MCKPLVDIQNAEMVVSVNFVHLCGCFYRKDLLTFSYRHSGKFLPSTFGSQITRCWVIQSDWGKILYCAKDYGTDMAFPRAKYLREKHCFCLEQLGKEISCLQLDESGFAKIPKYNYLHFYIFLSHGTIDISVSMSRKVK